jgi:HPr Serine kinase C-terminal domain
VTFAGTVPGVLGARVRDASQLPAHLPNALRIDPWTEAISGALLLTVPNVSRYLVQDGTTIDVEPSSGADRNSVELFLHGSARGSLIHQRGELPLDAATLAAPSGGAVALAGNSGVGKSTIAAELCRRGWRLIADDITRVTWTGGRLVAWPSHDALKLWRDACEDLGIDIQDLPRTREGMQKFYVKVPSMSQQAPLRAVIVLRMGSLARLADVPAGQGAALLSEHTFRKRQIEALERQIEHERIVQQVAGACRVMILDGARECQREVLADQIVRAIS